MMPQADLKVRLYVRWCCRPTWRSASTFD